MSTAMERHYTIGELAELWNVARTTVNAMFANEPDVLRVSMPRLMQRRAKPRQSLRIPASVAERVHQRWASSGRAKGKQRRGGIE